MTINCDYNFESLDRSSVSLWNNKKCVAKFDLEGNLVKPNFYFKSGRVTGLGSFTVVSYKGLEKLIMRIKEKLYERKKNII